MRPATAVIGFGNPLMGDEGVGPRIVSELLALGIGSDDVELLDMGTGGFAALHALEGRERVVLVDCAFMGEAPGTLRRFRPDEVRSRKTRLRTSLHEGDLLSMLDLAGAMGQAPAEVTLLGIEPARVEPGLELSPELETRLPEYTAAVRSVLAAGSGV